MKTRSLLQLIKDECAYHENNFNGIYNYCLTEETPDNKCIYFYEDKDDWYIIRCKYCEECVLPLDHDLEVKYWNDLKIDAEIISKEDKIIECQDCGKKIKVKTNRQKFCDKCAKKNRKKLVRENTKKYRDKKPISVIL